MHYITETETGFKTTPKQSQNRHSIDPITTRKKHHTRTKFTLQQL
jgi:hypothetical protein